MQLLSVLLVVFQVECLLINNCNYDFALVGRKISYDGILELKSMIHADERDFIWGRDYQELFSVYVPSNI